LCLSAFYFNSLTCRNFNSLIYYHEKIISIRENNNHLMLEIFQSNQIDDSNTMVNIYEILL
jgi:hypothetical protein